MESIDYYGVSHIVKKLPENNWLPSQKVLQKDILPKRSKLHRSNLEYYRGHTSKRQVINFSTNIPETLPMKFKRLLNEWREQAKILSSISAMAMLPPYQEIIGMGKPALALILNELKKKPDHLFWALRSISGIDPVSPEDRGRIDRMAKAWIEWGRQEKIIE